MHVGCGKWDGDENNWMRGLRVEMTVNLLLPTLQWDIPVLFMGWVVWAEATIFL